MKATHHFEATFARRSHSARVKEKETASRSRPLKRRSVRPAEQELGGLQHSLIAI